MPLSSVAPPPLPPGRRAAVQGFFDMLKCRSPYCMAPDRNAVETIRSVWVAVSFVPVCAHHEPPPP